MARRARLAGLVLLLACLGGCGEQSPAAGSSAPTAVGTLSPAAATALAATRIATTATPPATTAPVPGTATPSPANAAARACTGFVGATFAGAPFTSTLGLPQPAQVYTPTVTFTADTYTALVGDIVEESTYTCDQGTILFRQTTTPRGTYDPATDQLMWDTQPYHRLP